MFCALRNLIFFYRFYYFLGHIDKMLGSQCEISHPCYNHPARVDYSEIRCNPRPIKARISITKQLIHFISFSQVLNEMVTSLKEVQGISRVLYDLTSKPPGTTEWE